MTGAFNVNVLFFRESLLTSFPDDYDNVEPDKDVRVGKVALKQNQEL